MALDRFEVNTTTVNFVFLCSLSAHARSVIFHLFLLLFYCYFNHIVFVLYTYLALIVFV